jgi:hypothetical protein
MSMSQPLEPELGRPDEGIPAADPGAGAPQPAEGSGVAGEEPDRPPTYAAGSHADPPAGDDLPFRTPDPGEVGRG